MAEAESDIMRFAQPSKLTPDQYSEELVTKALWCGDAYEKYALNKIFNEVQRTVKTDKYNSAGKSKTNAKIVVISQIKLERRWKQVNFESIGFYEDHLEYASVENRPHCSSVVARIFWSNIHPNREFGRSNDDG